MARRWERGNNSGSAASDLSVTDISPAPSSPLPSSLLLLSPHSARPRTAIAAAAAGIAALTDTRDSHLDSGSTMLSSVAASNVPFLPLSPSSSRRSVPPSPELSASLSVSSYPVVVLRPSSCDSVVLFDPSSQQLTVYERRPAAAAAAAAGLAGSVVRAPRPLYLPPSSSRSASPSAGSPTVDALLPLPLPARRRWKKRKHAGAGESLTSRAGSDSGDCSLCPLCRQPWPRHSFSADRGQPYRRYSDSAAVAARQRMVSSGISGGSGSSSSRASQQQYTVTELDDEYDEQPQHDHYERDGADAQAEAAEAGAADADASADVSVMEGVLTTPLTSPDYFSLLSYTFLREQRQRQKQRRAVRAALRPLNAAQLLAIDDGTAAATADSRGAHEQKESWESEQQRQVPMDDGAADAVEVVQRRGAAAAPARLLPALLPPDSAAEVSDSDEAAEVEDASTAERSAPVPLSFAATTGAASASSSVRHPASSPLGFGPPSVDASSGGLCMAGLQSSSFVTGYYDRFFVRVRKLGSGTYGAVYLTCHVLEGVELGHYACKIIPVGDSKSWLQRVVAEVRALESVHHRHVVSYRHSWLEMAQVADFGPPVPCLFLLMQYCDLGTVAQLVWPTTDKAVSREGRPVAQHADTHSHSPRLGSPPTAATAADQQREQIEHIRAKRRSARREKESDEHKDGATQPPVDSSAAGTTAAAAAASTSEPAGDDVAYLLESDVWWIFLDTCLGLRHLHRCGILHMDLKLDNLLLTADRDARGRVQGRRVMLSDMGNAIIKGDSHQRTGNTGTMQYAAPETLLDPPAAQQQQRTDAKPASSTTAAANGSSSTGAFAYSEKSDLWSLGVCLYCLCYSKLPYEADTAAQLYALIHSQPLHLPAHPRRSAELGALITALLNVDPQKRPDAEAILNHPHIRRRREERQSNMQQQQQQQQQPQQPSPQERLQRREWTARPQHSDLNSSHSTASGGPEVEAGQQPTPQQSGDSHAAALTLRQASVIATLQNHSTPQHPTVAGAKQGHAPHQHSAPAQNGLEETKQQQQPDSSNSLHPPLAQRVAAPLPPRLPSMLVTQHHSPSRASALSILRSAAASSHLLTLAQPEHASPQLALLVPSPSLSADRNAEGSLGLIAAARAPSAVHDEASAATSFTGDCRSTALIPRPASVAVWRSVLSSSLQSDHWPAALNGVELLGHVCVVSCCAASVSVAPLLWPAVVASAPAWPSAAALPSSTVVWRACWLLPLVVPFSLCMLSLVLSVLLPAELLASLLSASPLLRRSTLSMSGRVCAAAGMCFYTLLLHAVLSAWS